MGKSFSDYAADLSGLTPDRVKELGNIIIHDMKHDDNEPGEVAMQRVYKKYTAPELPSSEVILCHILMGYCMGVMETKQRAIANAGMYEKIASGQYTSDSTIT